MIPSPKVNSDEGHLKECDERSEAGYSNKDHMPLHQSHCPSHAIFSSYKIWIKHGIFASQTELLGWKKLVYT